MKRLRSINIAGKKFAIKYEQMEDCWGMCDVDNFVITLHTDCRKNDELYRTTLLHECIHAVFRISGADYSCFDGDENKEESAVRAIESLFLPVLDQI